MGFGDDSFGDWDYGTEPAFPVRPRARAYLTRIFFYLALLPSLLVPV